VHAQTEYIKVRHRSDDPLPFWTKHNYAATYDAAQAADLRRLALVDALHQDQLQRRALAAGVITARFSTLPEGYTHDYAGVPTDLTKADTAAFKGTPIGAALHSTGAADASNSATPQPKDKGDSVLGFPPAVPLHGVIPDAKSYIGSIDRWPAALLTRRLCRMAYEEVRRHFIHSNTHTNTRN